MERPVVIPVVMEIHTDFLGLFQTPERTLTRHTTEPNAPLLIYFARKNKKTNEQKRTAPFLRTSNRRIDRGPSTQTEGTVSPNTDRPRPVNNIFIFSYWDLKVSGKFYFSLISSVPTHQLIVPSPLLAPATNTRTYKATKIHTLTPLTYKLFFQNSSKRKHRHVLRAWTILNASL